MEVINRANSKNKWNVVYLESVTSSGEVNRNPIAKFTALGDASLWAYELAHRPGMERDPFGRHRIVIDK